MDTKKLTLDTSQAVQAIYDLEVATKKYNETIERSNQKYIDHTKVVGQWLDINDKIDDQYKQLDKSSAKFYRTLDDERKSIDNLTTTTEHWKGIRQEIIAEDSYNKLLDREIKQLGRQRTAIDETIAKQQEQINKNHTFAAAEQANTRELSRLESQRIQNGMLGRLATEKKREIELLAQERTATQNLQSAERVRAESEIKNEQTLQTLRAKALQQAMEQRALATQTGLGIGAYGGNNGGVTGGGPVNMGGYQRPNWLGMPSGPGGPFGSGGGGWSNGGSNYNYGNVPNGPSPGLWGKGVTNTWGVQSQYWLSGRQGGNPYGQGNRLSMEQLLEPNAGGLFKSDKPLIPESTVNNHARNAERIAEANNKITLSWQAMVRIVETQILFRLISESVQMLREGVQTAAEFGRRIAEIETISQRSGRSTAEWAGDVRKLSNEFGSPLLETTAALYEAISNQVVKGADAYRFLREEEKLAMVTQASLNNTVNATSSILNAFRMDSSQANNVNATLFKTIELGRIRMDEMSSSMGRLSIMSKQLGVSFEEMNAGIATLTVMGMEPDVALTLMNNVMMHMIKPSKELTSTLGELGYNSGHAAIEALGLGGAIQKLMEVADQAPDKLGDVAKMFPNIRSMVGVTGLGSYQDVYEKNLEEIQTKSLADFNSATDIMMNSAGQKMKVQVAQIKNYFEELGEGVQASVLSWTGHFGGFVGTLQTFGTQLKVLIETWVAYKALSLAVNASSMITESMVLKLGHAYRYFTVQAKAAAVAMNLLKTAGPAVAIFAAIEGLTYISGETDRITEKLNSSREKDIENLSKTNERKLQEDQVYFNKQIALITDSTRTKLQAEAEITAVHNETLKKLTEQDKEYAKEFQRTNMEIVSAVQNRIQALGQTATAAKQQVTEIKNSMRSLSAKSEDYIFDSGIKEKDTEHSNAALKTNIVKLRKQGLAALAAGNQTDADAYFGRAEKYFEKYVGNLDKIREKDLKNLEKSKRAEEDEERRHQERLTAIQRTAMQRGVRGQARNQMSTMNAMADENQRHQDKLDAIERGDIETKLTERQIELLDKLFQAKLNNRQLDANHLTEELKKEGLSDKVLANELDRLAAIKSQTDFMAEQNRLQAERLAQQKKIEEDSKKQAETARGLLITLREQLSAADAFKGSADDYEKLLNKVKDTALEPNLNLPVGDVTHMLRFGSDRLATMRKEEETKKQLEEDAARQKAINAAKDAQVQKQQEVSKQREEARKGQETVFKGTREFADTLTVSGDSSSRKYTEPPAWIELNRRQGRSAGSVDVAADLAGDFNKQTRELAKTYQKFEDESAHLKSATDILKIDPGNKQQLQSVLQHTVVVQGLLEKLSLMTGGKDVVVNGHNLNKEAQAQIAQLKAQLTLTQQIEANTKALEQLNKNLEDVKAGNAPQGKYLGGRISRFNYGGSVGPDFIPALLQDGEYVWDKETTKMFGPMISALHSMPKRFNSGGSVTNVGDINVSVTGGSTSQQTIREIAAGLNREIRRGTIALNN